MAVPPDEEVVAFSVKLVGTDELLDGSVLVVAGMVGAVVVAGTVGAVVVAGADVVAWP